MNNQIFIILFSLMGSANASLMFTSQEVKTVLDKRTQTQFENLKNDANCLRCDGLIFQNKNQWSLWIDGQKYDPSVPYCREKKIKVTYVSKDSVQLEWQKNGEQHLVIFQPNEHYNATLKKVIKAQ